MIILRSQLMSIIKKKNDLAELYYHNEVQIPIDETAKISCVFHTNEFKEVQLILSLIDNVENMDAMRKDSELNHLKPQAFLAMQTLVHSFFELNGANSFRVINQTIWNTTDLCQDVMDDYPTFWFNQLFNSWVVYRNKEGLYHMELKVVYAEKMKKLFEEGVLQKDIYVQARLAQFLFTLMSKGILFNYRKMSFGIKLGIENHIHLLYKTKNDDYYEEIPLELHEKNLGEEFQEYFMEILNNVADEYELRVLLQEAEK